MKSNTFWTVFLVLLALLLIQPPANAVEQVATVVAARGAILAVDSNGNSRKLTVQDPVFGEDTVETGARGRVQIRFTDNTLVSLGQATTMKIAEYRWQPEKNDGALKTRIKEGAFRVMGGALAQAAPQNFKTETPTATIGIRGSMYAGVATADSLSVVFQGGKGIEITNSFGTVTITKPGYGTKAALGSPPLKPVKFSARDLDELSKALNGRGVEEKEEQKIEGTSPEEQEATSSSDQQPATGGASSEASSSSADFTVFTDEETIATAGPLPGTLDEGGSVPATETFTVTNLRTTVATDTSQTMLANEVSGSTTSTTSPTESTGSALTGYYRFFLRDIDLTLSEPFHYDSTFLNYKSGMTNAIILATGELSGTLANGDTFGPYLINGYAPAAAGYAGISTVTNNISYLDSTLGPVNLTTTTYADSGGQFFYNTFHHSIDSTTDYLISRLIYAGLPATTIPTGGIDLFTGHLIHNNTSGASYDADREQTSIEVSYYNRRIIGRSSEMDPASGKSGGAIFFGTLNSDGSAALSIIASGNPGNSGPPPTGPPTATGSEVISSSGSATANLYGNFHQGLGFTASGGDYSLFDNIQTSTWEATGGALRMPTTKIISNYPTSPQTYSGFVVGIADDTSTGAASRIFMSGAAGDFSMTADPTTGVLSGSINAAELTSAGAVTLSGLTVGGTAANSAFIGTEDMVAVLSGSNLALSDHGNLLYNNGPLGPQITSVANSYLTWGYWEMAYTDPLDGSRDHLFSSQSFFVAGQPTDPAYISSIMNTPFSGTYTGKAFGVELDPAGQNAMPLSNGTTNLTVNFQDPAVANTVTGSINFDQASLTINSAASTLNNNGFSAYVSSVSGVTPMSSAVNGAFYGPAAEGVGGNFNAKLGTGVSYLGIFGGSR